MKFSSKLTKIGIFSLILFLIGLFLNISILSAKTDQENYSNPAIEEIQRKIREKEEKIKSLENERESLSKTIELKREEKISLENELAILDAQMSRTLIDIATTEAEIEKIELEIQKLEQQIEKLETELKKEKKKLGRLLRQIYFNQQKGYFEIFLTYESLSDFLTQTKYTEKLQSEVKQTLDQVKRLKIKLEAQKKEAEAKKDERQKKLEQLELEKKELEGEREYKNSLLEQTQSLEASYQSLLNELKEEQRQIEAELAALEAKARELLKNKRRQKENIKSRGEVSFIWPIDPVRGISAYFHDPTYPFRHIFEHPAIDIRAYQGTPVKAAASGYVAVARDGGLGYSYVAIIHDDGFMTVYGHLSRIDVVPDSYVTQGQVIGLSGGTPGTPGAGRLTTGPHLHFEIRLNGIPVDPLLYLP